MTTIAASSGSRSSTRLASIRAAPHPVVVAAAAVIAPAGLAGSVLVATSGQLIDRVTYGLELAVIVVGTAAVALVWAVARPGNRIAPALLLYAAAITGVSLQGAASPLLHSFGVLFDIPAFLLGYYLVFVFPEGLLTRTLEKVLLAATAAVVFVSFLPRFFFSPVVSGTAPLAGCNAGCPTNPLMIADKPSIANGFGTAEHLFAALVAAAIVGGLSYRLATASRPRRRALLPVYVPALMMTISFAVFQAASGQSLNLDPSTHRFIGWFLTASRTVFTFGFLVAIGQATLFAGAALKTIIGRLERDEDAQHLRDLVAEALDDPQLELAFEVEPRSRYYIDCYGDPIDPTRTEVDQSATPLRRGGEIVAYIVHDAALETDPELVQAAGQSVLLALESGYLASELESKTAELQASRARIVAAAERERQRLERNLHDGAQQRLMTLQVKLMLAQEQAKEDGLAERLEEIRVDAAAAAEDLRALAHGIYPAVLVERGLPDAFRSLALSAAIPIHVTDEGIGRCPEATEAAIYFCSLEAIQNAAKHAGPGASVWVTVGRDRGAVHFTIADDGVGMERRASSDDGVGLASMQDRISAVGGGLAITSSAGGGTTVSGRVPDDRARSSSTEREYPA
jgi:signal transduction histidine kinase